MAIITRPPNNDYDNGYEGSFGRKCFFCKKPLDKAKPKEWAENAHEDCAKERDRSERGEADPETV